MANKSQIKLKKSVVLVGMMGCGKSAIGRRLASEIGVEFFDLDIEIEKRENMAIPEIFQKHGEPYFRNLEEEVLNNLISQKPCILATGGGAFMSEKIRSLVENKAISVWIRADFDVLLDRVSRKNNRPLLEGGDKAKILKDLIEKRYPIYKKADITVDTSTGEHKIVVGRIIEAIK